MARRCPCIGGQSAVIVIGVLTGITATILSVVMVTAFVTLEGQRRACLHFYSSNDLHLLESCILFNNASFVLTSRVFYLVQISIWLLLLAFSILLIIGAIKGRNGFLVPWVVLTVVVIGSIVYDAVRAGIRGEIKSLLISLAAIVIATGFLVFVNAYSRKIRQRQKVEVKASSTTSLRVFSNPMGPYDGLHRHTPPAFMCTSGGDKPVARYLTHADIALCHDLPPDYATASAASVVNEQTVEHSKQIKIPTSLGVMR